MTKSGTTDFVRVTGRSTSLSSVVRKAWRRPSLLEVRQKHIADALAALREAIGAGWKDFAHMQKDPDLTVLRDLPEFQAPLPRRA